MIEGSVLQNQLPEMLGTHGLRFQGFGCSFLQGYRAVAIGLDAKGCSG